MCVGDKEQQPFCKGFVLLYVMICHSKKCHRPCPSSRHNEQGVCSNGLIAVEGQVASRFLGLPLQRLRLMVQVIMLVYVCEIGASKAGVLLTYIYLCFVGLVGCLVGCWWMGCGLGSLELGGLLHISCTHGVVFAGWSLQDGTVLV